MAGPGRSVRLLRHPDQRGSEQPVLEHVAGLHLLDDRAGLGIAGDFDHCLVAVRVEPFADRLDAADPVPRENLIELARRGFNPGEELRRGLVGAELVADRRQRALDMILDRQHVARERGRGIARRLFLLRFEPAANVLRAVKCWAKMPTKSEPNGASPLSIMVQIAITRPRNSSGTILCTIVFEASNSVTIENPINSITGSDKANECENDSSTRLPPKPAAAIAAQSPSVRTLPKAASTIDPKIAPMPDAPISNPNSVGPPCNISRT